MTCDAFGCENEGTVSVILQGPPEELPSVIATICQPCADRERDRFALYRRSWSLMRRLKDEERT